MLWHLFTVMSNASMGRYLATAQRRGLLVNVATVFERPRNQVMDFSRATEPVASSGGRGEICKSSTVKIVNFQGLVASSGFGKE